MLTKELYRRGLITRAEAKTNGVALGRKAKDAEYVYCVRAKADGAKFVCFGNPKDIYTRTMYLYPVLKAGEKYEYEMKTPFGIIRNVSSGIRYNAKDYYVVRQYLMEV